MAVYISPEQFRALADEDPRAFAERVVDRMSMVPVLIEHHALITRRPDLQELLREVVPEYRRKDLETWLRRKLIPVNRTEVELDDFCRLATRVVNAHDDAFPALKARHFELTHRYTFAAPRRADTRKNGVGWVAWGETRFVGPAEAIREEEWHAVAHHRDWTLEVGLEAAWGYLAYAWAEPLGAP